MRLLALSLALTTTVASAQTLDRRIASAPDGTVQFAFASRPGICGDGRTLIADETPGSGGYRTWVFHGDMYSMGGAADWRAACLPGPVWVLLSKAGARMNRLEVYAGPELRLTARGTDLGRVAAADAAAWLLDLGERAEVDDVVGRAFLAASLADSTRLTDRLIRIARNRERRPQPRERAVRWLAEVSEREGATAAADAALQAIASDESEMRGVRERAIRDLRRAPETDAFLRGVYGRIGDLGLKERIIRRLGESWSEENTRWVRALALNARESLRLRERALRILGEQGQAAFLREVYPQLDASSLKEWVIRAVGEHGGGAEREWLLQRVLDSGEGPGLRDRALRSWAEGAGVADIRSLYPRLAEHELRDRLLRLAGERGERTWLRDVAANASERAEIRDRAVRLLAESGIPTAELVGLYDTARSRPVQSRLVRLLAERGDDDAIDKLIGIARTDPDAELRRLALRRLAETRHPKARTFLEETVRR